MLEQDDDDPALAGTVGAGRGGGAGEAGGEGPGGPELAGQKAESEGTQKAGTPAPQGETYGKGPHSPFQDALVRAAKKVELSCEMKILDAMGKGEMEGEGVRTQWYNFLRSQGAPSDEADWSNKENVHAECVTEFLKGMTAGKEWDPPCGRFEKKR